MIVLKERWPETLRVPFEESAAWLGFCAAARAAGGAPQRLKVLETACLHVDLTLQRQSDDLDAATAALLAERDLDGARRALFSGEAVNWTEDRPAWHTALRAWCSSSAEQALPPVLARELAGERARQRDFVRAVEEAGRYTHVLHIGIGGSDWGPRLAVRAFGANPRREIRFVSSIDAAALQDALHGLNPRHTLVLLASRSFATVEMLHNAKAAIAWLGKAGIADISEHLVAVTANVAAARAMGVPAGRIFRLWDWTGGRYSIWSATGLALALAVGIDALDDLHAGAAAMDTHFQEAPLASNAPVQMALAGIVNCSVLGFESLNISAYGTRLDYLPAYLQHLEMESLGKCAAAVEGAGAVRTSPVVWGMAGTEGQHTFYQWLHQAPVGAPVDFIACLQDGSDTRESQRLLFANCLAQREALWRGKTLDAARAEIGASVEPALADRLARHQVYPGRRPSTLIVLPRLTPRALGALIALYEHKVFVQSVVWGLNAFDQWGVALGKTLAARIARQLSVPAAMGEVDWRHDVSTSHWIDRVRSNAALARERRLTGQLAAGRPAAAAGACHRLEK